MTNSGDRPRSARSERTRDALITAGIDLLAEGGWEAVTTRAAAARAGSNAGLIHYHFGGLPGLRTALAERASADAIGPLIGPILRSGDFDAAISALQDGIAGLVADDRRIRLATQLIAGAGQDPELGAAFRQNLRGARAAIAEWLGRQRPQWPAERITGAAALIAAVLDGLLLHRALDDDAPLDAAIAALRGLAASTDPDDPSRRSTS
ncbi:TetR/AcrR family transcriptional regulator [Microbacterium halophytorum]|uniref:TetR/AcrR family transcriptional regulator n=1 Tax=Microbacterium halophytorum TaxID=2067568 RepID=UPI0018E09CBE|nr:TetR/AcrR family transcriptional regulator [Microbacterium halophytorum]